MRTSKFNDSQIMETLKRAPAEEPVLELCRELEISFATFYKWRSKFGSMDTRMIIRLKDLELENTRLKKIYAQEKLKALLRLNLQARHSTPSMLPCRTIIT